MTVTLVAALTILFCLTLSHPFSIGAMGQSLCAGIFARQTPFADLDLALLCGVSAVAPHHAELFKGLGLYHLLVISGFHLHLLWLVAAVLLRRRGIVFQCATGLLLAGFVGCQLPILRSLAQFALTSLQKRHRLFWRPQQTVFITHLLFVVANPSLVSSLSLLLSSLASSCLLVSRNPWRVAATMYITSLPLWIVLGAPSPLSILINAALAPALSILLFLAALFSQWAPPTMASLPWQLLLEILQWLARHTASELTTVPVPSALVVVYSLSLLALRVQNEMFRLPDRPFYLADRSRPRLNVLQ